MNKMSPEIIEKYKQILQKDPRSKVFAALADALIENGALEEALKISVAGLKLNPEYPSGHVAYARVQMEFGETEKALASLKKACLMDPQNILGQQLLAHCYLEVDEPKLALKAFKMVLFFNPGDSRAQNAISKLESLTADEYEEDLFTLGKTVQTKPKLVINPAANPQSSTALKTEFDRKIAFIDALILRNDIESAKKKLSEIAFQNPENEEVKRRWALLNEHEGLDDAEEIEPILSREKQILDRKITNLQKILKRIGQRREESLGLS